MSKGNARSSQSLTNLTTKTFFRAGNERLRQAKRMRTDSDTSQAANNNPSKTAPTQKMKTLLNFSL